MTWGFSEAVGAAARRRSAGATSSCTSPTRGRSSPRVTFDYGVRYSLFFNPYAADDQITSFVPALFNPALGNDPCNGLLQPPGTQLVPGRRRPGRHGRPEPLADGAGLQQLRAAPRRRLGRHRQRQDGRPRAASASSSCASGSRPVLSIAANPPFVDDAQRHPQAGHARPSRAPAASASSLGAPTRGREVDSETPNNWQWNLTVQQRDLAQHDARGRLRRQLRLRPAADPRRQPGAQRRHQRQRRRRSAGVRRSRRRPTRRCASSASSATPTSASGTTAASRPITRCRRSSSAASAAARSSRRRTRCRARGRTSR